MKHYGAHLEMRKEKKKGGGGLDGMGWGQGNEGEELAEGGKIRSISDL